MFGRFALSHQGVPDSTALAGVGEGIVQDTTKKPRFTVPWKVVNGVKNGHCLTIPIIGIFPPTLQPAEREQGDNKDKDKKVSFPSSKQCMVFF